MGHLAAEQRGAESPGAKAMQAAPRLGSPDGGLSRTSQSFRRANRVRPGASEALATPSTSAGAAPGAGAPLGVVFPPAATWRLHWSPEKPGWRRLRNQRLRVSTGQNPWRVSGPRLRPVCPQGAWDPRPQPRARCAPSGHAGSSELLPGAGRRAGLGRCSPPSALGARLSPNLRGGVVRLPPAPGRLQLRLLSRGNSSSPASPAPPFAMVPPPPPVCWDRGSWGDGKPGMPEGMACGEGVVHLGSQ